MVTHQTTDLYGGIEGGTTGSRITLLDVSGKLLGFAEGPHTNHWHLGYEETAKRVAKLVTDALLQAGLPSNTKLKSLGLSLSGVDTEENEIKLVEAMHTLFPDLSEHVFACNDSVGALFTAAESSGIVLIAGTGSICKYVRPDLSYVRVGGFGYLLGDEGSAYWISVRAIMAYMRATEDLIAPNYDIKHVSKLIIEHFGVKHHHEIIPYFTEKFEKSFIAKLCKSIAEAANNGDAFARELFHEAGYLLGRHVSTAIRAATEDHPTSIGAFEVICVGSVFKSWSLIESGFKDGVRPRRNTDCQHGTLRLYFLRCTAAYGAARVAAKVTDNTVIPRPPDTTQLLCELHLSELQSYRQGSARRPSVLIGCDSVPLFKEASSFSQLPYTRVTYSDANSGRQVSYNYFNTLSSGFED